MIRKFKKSNKFVSALSAITACFVFAATVFASGVLANEILSDNNEESNVPSFKVRYLGIIQGDADGEYNMGNPITRAEMAKIVASAKGLVGYGSTQAETEFSDVPIDHWASGYISVMYQSGIIRGDGDGTFSPDDNVSYAQAIKMIVHALGYFPKAESIGGYPQGYVRTATELGITKGINIVLDNSATRGNVAIMIDRALDIPQMEQTTFRADGGQVDYQISDGMEGRAHSTLLSNCFGIPNALFQYFEAFADADYETMKLYSTEEHIATYFQEGNVFGDKWAKLTNLDGMMIPQMRNNNLHEDECAFFVDVEMETAPTSALYPETKTSFYIIFKKEGDIWKVHRFATNLWGRNQLMGTYIF